ncbi:hypothetical protein PM082_022085 [Marasmius tenuissimus]|nr:hypothetical protein PM082_022085 [Marasmius tenuissimus]
MKHNLTYLINHIFFPPKLPESNDFTHENEHDMCRSVLMAAQAYRTQLPPEEQPLWMPIIQMLITLCTVYKHEGSFEKENLASCLRNMEDRGAFLYLSCLIIRKHEDRTVFEMFEVSPPNEVVMGTAGKLICSYPGPAIAIPSETANDPDFISAISSFLAQMHVDVIDAAMPTTEKAGSKVEDVYKLASLHLVPHLDLLSLGPVEPAAPLQACYHRSLPLPSPLDAQHFVTEEIRDTPSPRFISELLTGILRGYGRPEDVDRITKRVADDVLWDKTFLPWRRSPMWLVIRVALQTTLKDHAGVYKSFLAFLMSAILREAVAANMDSDTLAAMYKKLARSVFKIHKTAPAFLQSEALEVVNLAQGLLQKRWNEVQKAHASDGLAGWDPSSLDIPQDTKLSLHNSREYIRRECIRTALNNRHDQRSGSAFEPNDHPRLKELDGYSARSLGKQIRKLGVLALFDFEQAVETGIDDLFSNRDVPGTEHACALIWEWMERYSVDATRLYKGHPEQNSIMFLTLLELWVGLDKLAVWHDPLLREYSPEVQESIFEPLLLRCHQSIKRLEQAIGYLRARHADANHTLPSIFSSTISLRSFAVRYFEKHPALQILKAEIEVKALKDREEKKRELDTQMVLYHKRLSEAESFDHFYQYNARKRRDTHRGNECLRCLRGEPQSPAAEADLFDYSGLAPFRNHSVLRRLTLASTTKPWVKSHYNGVKVSSATVNRVCLPNALHLALFNATERIWISDPFRACTIGAFCTYQLPQGRYYNLQFTINSTHHTPNEVIASQSDCHRDLSLHEYIAFGTLRAGGRIQWLNILRELRARTLTFSDEAVEMLVSQTALQMGPLSGDGHWAWHEPLEDNAFHTRLIEELEALRTSIQANWSEVGAMRIVILLIHCVLRWSSNSDVTGRALTLLENSRSVTFGWMKELEKKLQSATEDESSGVQLRLWEMAAAVRSTFDITPRLLQSAPCNILLEAGMILRDNIPGKSDLAHALEEPTSQVIIQDHQFSHAVEPILAILLACDNNHLHHAAVQYWPMYRFVSPWRHSTFPNNRWLYLTSSTGHLVFFDVLESQLLVDGKPLSRLPSSYVSHPTYVRIFGKTIFNVIPPGNSEPSADFATKDSVNGYQIFFTLPSPDNLVIQAKSVETQQQFQLIPHTLFEGDLPTTMVENFTHWLSLQDSIIELRPSTNIWVPSRTNWQIDIGQRQMWKNPPTGGVRLVDVRSKTARMIASRLSCLEQIDFIIVTYSSTAGETLVELPRYRLDFQLNSQGKLVCLTLPNMVVDSNQSAGIMIGLRNRLVLRDLVCNTRRELLIPIGEISFQTNGHHTQVSINPVATFDRRVQYFRYGIDEPLGRLVGTSPSLHTRLYKIYLMALTSYLLPDRLTERTGTEETLRELRSAACKSFISLDDESQDLLNKIANITPKREYYPSHLKVMQTVKWITLPTLAQHDSFLNECRGILGGARKCRLR